MQAGAEDFANNDWCEQEFSYAHMKMGKAHMIPVVTEPAALSIKVWVGPVAFVLGGALFVDASSADKVAAAAAVEIAARVGKLVV